MSEPVYHQIQQLSEHPALVVAKDSPVQVEADAFDRIQVRRVPGQEVNHDPVAMHGEILLRRFVVVKDRVVEDHMDLAVASQSCAMILQLSEEQNRVSASRRTTTRLPRKQSPFAMTTDL